MTEGIDVDIPAAWHPDPLGRYEYRYWDGQRWTEHVANQGIAGVDATGLEPPASTTQQAGGWGATGDQQPTGGQPASGWSQDPGQQASGWSQDPRQQASGWSQDPGQQAQESQRTVAGSASEPAHELASGTAAVGGHPATADDPDHWQRPWTTAALAQTDVPADQPAAGAGQDEDPTHWQRPWTEEPSAAAAPATTHEHRADVGPGMVAEPAAGPEPAATAVPPDEVDPVGQAEPTSGAPAAAGALPHWQQPWAPDEPEGATHDAVADSGEPREPGAPDEPDASQDNDLAPAPATVEEAIEEDEVTGADRAGTVEDDLTGTEVGDTMDDPVHDTSDETPPEPVADERAHWQQPWTSSTPSA